MKTNRSLTLTGLAVAVGGIIAWALISQHQVAPAHAGGDILPAAKTPEVSPAPKISAPETEPAVVESLSLVKSTAAKVDARNNAAKPADVAPAGPPIVINGYEVQDPIARVALSFVGSDPVADAYWTSAINDPTMPSEERKDLIEDLNEDGFIDPQHPTAEDLPLIVSRIRLIEQLAPSAMDDVNRDAFAEAYKDLVYMLNGQPAQ